MFAAELTELIYYHHKTIVKQDSRIHGICFNLPIERS